MNTTETKRRQVDTVSTAIVEDLVTGALGLSTPQVMALKVGAMLVADLLRRPASEASLDSSILSSTPGRLRLQVGGLKGSAHLARRIEDRVGVLPGIDRVKANTVTGTVLVTYDPQLVDEATISRAARTSTLALRVAKPDSKYRLSVPESVAV